ncbi:hypothetical protein Aph01nite_62850 [Acrocarpospora phusangensis]|uniref:SHOCT domain-containing protein n=1 Tax=Acrocarpospora phusangensis TaxID=1070424 RepID=A0A919QIE1_9ACTN|nr:SHOCT domain-containing protein [Acrocarpospora phusangensis]GIH27975.1 hypothetical protein Aph01nite_62850 [Acrocarpospora phusangensis]
MTSTALLLTAALLFLLAVVIGVVMVVVLSRHPRHAFPAHTEDPREILRRRYAAGEIDEAEYLRRLSTLANS